jgi:signal transduction histidine kinase
VEQYRDQLEAQVEERTAELVAAKEQAESADRLKSAFLAAVSHELRTPLNSIIGFTGMVLQGTAGPLTEEQERQLSVVRTSSRQLHRLVKAVLDISELESGQLELRREPFAMADAVAAAATALSPEAREKGLAITVDPGAGAIHCRGDQPRVEQVLINLLDNAVKFTTRGSVTVSCQREGDRLITRISDTGMGISPDSLESIFDPFSQLDRGTARRYRGTGLGLSICRRLLALMDGEITAASEGPSKGSTFSFSLPVHES